jgi:L-amino acid N-acyltransferase
MADSRDDDVLLRPAREADAPAFVQILNHYVLHTTSTFMTEPVTLESRVQFITQRKPEHALWVAEHAGHAIGWAALGEYKARGGYRHTVESSVYLHPDRTGRGVGRALMQRVIDDARSAGFHVLIAGACAEQRPSIVLHERLGFERVAHFREVGRKFDRWLDVVYLQRMLQAAS